MADPSIEHPEWDVDLPDAPFSSRVQRVGAAAGAQELGAALYEIDPGGAISPYHVHHGNEELLIVLSGHPRLRSPSGVRELSPGAVVAFPRGPDGAHQVSNAGDGPARVIVVSTMHFPEVAEHVDTGTVLAATGQQEGHAFPAGTDVPFMDAVLQALQTAPDSR